MEDKNFDELDDKTKVIISKMEKAIKEKDSEIKNKNEYIEDLKNQIAFLKGQIINKNRKIFGQSREQESGDQLSFFDAAEHAVKLFVIGGKNWLFSNTPKGAKSSAILYSIVETAKANGLAVEMYLIYLFDVLSKTENRDMEFLEEYMPWSADFPDYLYSKSRI